MRVVFLTSAEGDLREIRRYVVKSFGPEVWQETYQKIKDSLRTIATFPHGGSIPAELTDLGLQQYRQVISGMNRVIYEVKGDVVFIHVICDTRRNMRTLLTRRLLGAG